MSAVQLFDDVFTRANGAPGNGWVPQHAGIWAIASNQLVATADGAATPQAGAFGILRPASEDRLDQKIVITFTATTAGALRYCMLRYNRTTGDKYVCYAGVAGCGIQKIVGGSGAPIVSTGGIPDGHVARLTFTASGTGPTTLTAVLFDVTAGAQVQSLTQTDTAATLQGVGGFGVLYDAATNGTAVAFAEITTSDLDGATGYTLTPASAAVHTGIAQTFSVAPVGGSLIGTITPHVTGSAVASPTTLVYTGQNTAMTFNVTDAAPEVVTVSVTNSASLANPGNATLTVTKKRKRGGAAALLRRARMAASFQLPPRSRS